MKESKAKIDKEVNKLFEVKLNEELTSYEVALDFERRKKEAIKSIDKDMEG
jgi:hypothetical protein